MFHAKNVVFQDKLGLLEVDICAVPGWDGFDKLVKYLENEYSLNALRCIDGPDARCWVFEKNGKRFELRFEDPYGNSLVATEAASESVVREIGLDLENRLKGL